jgi:excisionase family DNA binding protein
MSNDGVPQLLTLPEVATRLRCSTDEVMGLVEEGRLHPVRLFREYRFRADEVERLIDDATLPTEEEISLHDGTYPDR